MPGRDRQLVVRSNGGEYGRFGLVLGTGDFTKQVSGCGDVTGPGDNAPFSVNKFSVDGGVIEKPYTGFFSSYFNSYTADYVRNLYNSIDHLDCHTMSTVEAATRGAARTNPSRPYVDVPVEVLQLHEIPDILKAAGNSILARVGGANLALQFGIQPVAQDLARLVNMQSMIARRAAELHSAQQKGGMKRTIVVDAGSAEAIVNTIIQSDGLFIRDDVRWSSNELVKVHARWNFDGSYSSLQQNDEMYALARRAVQGGILDYSTIWQLCPWSWLADYFGNVGEYFAASRNIVGMTLTDVAVMRHTVTTLDGNGFEGPDWSMTSWRGRWETKRRVTSFIAPTLSSDNFFNSNQMGILASIAATRRY